MFRKMIEHAMQTRRSLCGFSQATQQRWSPARPSAEVHPSSCRAPRSPAGLYCSSKVAVPLWLTPVRIRTNTVSTLKAEFFKEQSWPTSWPLESVRSGSLSVCAWRRPSWTQLPKRMFEAENSVISLKNNFVRKKCDRFFCDRLIARKIAINFCAID